MQLKSIQLDKLLPPNMQSIEERVLYKVLNVSYEKMAYYASQLAIYSDIDCMEEMILDHLAWQRKSDLYESTMNIETKRAVVKSTPMWHQQKGTAAAVEDVVSKIFDTSTVKEWFEAGLQPHQFAIETTDNLTSREKIDDVKTAVNKVKRLSSHLTTIVVKRESNLSESIGIGIYKHKKLTIGGE
jgi:phage tail P2-like protein